ncbi:unnamed protein product [Cylindrotheca closterium]|uniref:Uncharacterized protein n=1 Tax=Cylindrotheca closterium TaxID=2856 RepID=A0AAD2FKU0_9STRA|nr:unnamed protein product [Cylindrotheca closterium]
MLMLVDAKEKMDALGGYGSESSSSANEKKASNQKSSLIGLLGSPLSGTDDDDQQVEAPRNPQKRQKLQGVGRNETFARSIPSPRTTSAYGTSIAQLDEDYLSPMLKLLHYDETSKANMSCFRLSMAQKLRSANESMSCQTLAQNVRSQSDYHNPRFLEIVRDRFRIERSLQSRAKHVSSDLKQYEKQLFQIGHVDGLEQIR